MESELWALVAIVGIGCSTLFLAMPFLLIRTFMDRKLKIAEMQVRANERAVREGLEPIREEMARLRRETNDLVLSFDTTLQRLDARLQRLEQQVLAPAPQETPAQAAEPTGRPPRPPLPAAEDRSWVESHVAAEPQAVVVHRPPR